MRGADKPEMKPVLDSKAGNEYEGPSLTDLFEQLEVPLLRYASHLVNREEVAQDLVQEAFLQLHRHHSTVTAPKPWFYRTVHNLGLNYHRNENRVVSLHPESDPGAHDPSQGTNKPMIPDESILRLEAIGQIRLVLAALSPQKRDKPEEIIRLLPDYDSSDLNQEVFRRQKQIIIATLHR